jgi:hypothetical protein
MDWVAPQQLLAAEYLHEQWQPDKVRWCLLHALTLVGK